MYCSETIRYHRERNYLRDFAEIQRSVARDDGLAPRVSVIIPTYKAMTTIETTIMSLMNQTFTDFEIIVVDDSSPDETPVIARNALEMSGSRHTVVKLGKNSGPSVARNAGVALARAEYVAFLDADDIWMPDKLALQVELLDRHPEVTLCACKVDRMTTEGILIGPLFQGLPSLQPDGWKRLLWDSFVHTSAAVARRADLSVDPFDSRLRVAEDRDLWITLASGGTVGLVQEVLVHKVESPSSYMSRNQMLVADDTVRMVDYHTRRMRDRLTLADRLRIFGSLNSSIGKGLASKPGHYLRSAKHLLLAIGAGYKVFDNARMMVLGAPPLRSFRALWHRGR